MNHWNMNGIFEQMSESKNIEQINTWFDQLFKYSLELNVFYAFTDNLDRFAKIK